MKIISIKEDLLWHLKNALDKKIAILPFIAPCYLALFVWNYIGYYIDDFLQTVMQKTDNERAIYIKHKQEQKAVVGAKAIFAFYALTATLIYWFVFGFSRNLAGLEILNYPTYFLTAIPMEAISQISEIRTQGLWLRPMLR